MSEKSQKRDKSVANSPRGNDIRKVKTRNVKKKLKTMAESKTSRNVVQRQLSQDGRVSAANIATPSYFGQRSMSQSPSMGLLPPIMVRDNDSRVLLTDKHSPQQQREDLLRINRHHARLEEITSANQQYGGNASFIKRKPGEPLSYQKQTLDFKVRAANWKMKMDTIQREKQNLSMLTRLLEIQKGKIRTTDTNLPNERLVNQAIKAINVKNLKTSAQVRRMMQQNKSPNPTSPKSDQQQSQKDDKQSVLPAKTPSVTTPGSALTLSSNTVQNIKSLNIGAKKKEVKRIEIENAKMAKKIYFAEPELKAKMFEKDFQSHLYVSNQMAKIKRKKIDDSVPKNGLILPPIEETHNTLPVKGKTPKTKLSRRKSSMKSGRASDQKQYI